MQLAGLWRDAEIPNKAHFLFRIADHARAEKYVNHPDSAAAGRRAGVIDGGLTYVEEAD